VPRANGDAPEPIGELAVELDDSAEAAAVPAEMSEPADEADVSARGAVRDGADVAMAEADDSVALAPEEAAEDAGAFADEPAFFDEIELAGEHAGRVLDPLLTPPDMAQMLFVEVALMLPATHPVVVLQEADSPFRELRIPVGGAEGIAIAYAARGIETPRPLTHELFTRVLEEFSLTLDMVHITDVSGSSFSAEIVVSGPLGSRTIDCRPSDAIALALRQRLPVPIMASPIVLAIAGSDPLGAN
jgi:bifunctional DNase/RNase